MASYGITRTFVLTWWGGSGWPIDNSITSPTGGLAGCTWKGAKNTQNSPSAWSCILVILASHFLQLSLGEPFLWKTMLSTFLSRDRWRQGREPRGNSGKYLLSGQSYILKGGQRNCHKNMYQKYNQSKLYYTAALQCQYTSTAFSFGTFVCTFFTWAQTWPRSFTHALSSIEWLKNTNTCLDSS